MVDTRTAAQQLINVLLKGDAPRDEVAVLLEALGQSSVVGSLVDGEDMVLALRDRRPVANDLLDEVARVLLDVTQTAEQHRVAAVVVARASLWGAVAAVMATAASEVLSPLALLSRYPREVALANVAALEQLSGGPVESFAIAARARINQLRVEGRAD